MKPVAPVTKHFIKNDAAILQQSTSGSHKKFFTLAPQRLTWKRDSEKLRRRMPAKSNAKKRTGPASQRDLDIKIEFMEGLVRRDPGYVDALQLLGDHYTQRGRYAEGLKVDERLAHLVPGDALVFYNLACSYSLTDQFDRATLALEKALSLGYRDFAWLARDPDLKKFRQQPAYNEIKARIRRMKSKTG
jgi:tetratricopeptide (TPR) repeat protein